MDQRSPGQPHWNDSWQNCEEMLTRGACRQSSLVGALDGGNALGVIVDVEIVFFGTPLVEFDHERTFRFDVVEEMREIMAHAVVNQIMSFFEAMPRHPLKRLHEHSIKRKLGPEFCAQRVGVLE